MNIILAIIAFTLICISCILYVVASSLCELTKSIKDMSTALNNVRYHLECIDNSLRKIKDIKVEKYENKMK